MDYLNWQTGSFALSSIALGYWLGTGKLLGVSGLMEKVVTLERGGGPIHTVQALGFLLALIVGGTVGAVLKGNLALDFSPGGVHQSLFGQASLLVMGFGGVLVGFGTRLGSGCTSGHGLSGCSRLQPRSLVATASFFGTAILVSFLLKGAL